MHTDIDKMEWREIIYCQAQPKVKTKASAFGSDGYNIIIIQPSTHPPGQV